MISLPDCIRPLRQVSTAICCSGPSPKWNRQRLVLLPRRRPITRRNRITQTRKLGVVPIEGVRPTRTARQRNNLPATSLAMGTARRRRKRNWPDRAIVRPMNASAGPDLSTNPLGRSSTKRNRTPTPQRSSRVAGAQARKSNRAWMVSEMLGEHRAAPVGELSGLDHGVTL